MGGESFVFYSSLFLGSKLDASCLDVRNALVTLGAFEVRVMPIPQKKGSSPQEGASISMGDDGVRAPKHQDTEKPELNKGDHKKTEIFQRIKHLSPLRLDFE